MRASAHASAIRHRGYLLTWRLAGVQDEEQEAQEAPPARDFVGEQLAGGIRRGCWLAADRYPEAGHGEGGGHCRQLPGPEPRQRAPARTRPPTEPVPSGETIGSWPAPA